MYLGLLRGTGVFPITTDPRLPHATRLEAEILPFTVAVGFLSLRDHLFVFGVPPRKCGFLPDLRVGALGKGRLLPLDQ